jgi:hypothetical protein
MKPDSCNGKPCLLKSFYGWAGKNQWHSCMVGCNTIIGAIHVRDGTTTRIQACCRNFAHSLLINIWYGRRGGMQLYRCNQRMHRMQWLWREDVGVRKTGMHHFSQGLNVTMTRCDATDAYICNGWGKLDGIQECLCNQWMHLQWLRVEDAGYIYKDADTARRMHE